jgi:hypothetical protein
LQLNLDAAANHYRGWLKSKRCDWQLRHSQKNLKEGIKKIHEKNFAGMNNDLARQRSLFGVGCTTVRPDWQLPGFKFSFGTFFDSLIRLYREPEMGWLITIRFV